MNGWHIPSIVPVIEVFRSLRNLATINVLHHQESLGTSGAMRLVAFCQAAELRVQDGHSQAIAQLASGLHKPLHK